ncbi:MAG: peptidase M28, partial [Proteobacteria bacterium]|nr:peptidase M28 [Pseudomonadota bacterium]
MPSSRRTSTRLAGAAGLLAVACAGAAPPRMSGPDGAAPANPQSRSEPLLSRIRQLTFEGRRSGEGYFGPAGRRIVFQSEREPGNPFYQIYRMDLATGDVERVSPGIGKTTCAWIHPGGSRVLFASTHAAANARAEQEEELARREAGETRRYAWDYDPDFDLYSSDLDGSPPRALAAAPGYDAEASWSPDGRTVVFASNRHAYDPILASAFSAQDHERLASDPSAFIDLYTVDSRGGNLRRLTTSPGYDGGPFFSPDGSRIVWRRFSEDGVTAEIYSMKVDG